MSNELVTIEVPKNLGITKYDTNEQIALELKQKYTNLVITASTLQEAKVALTRIRNCRYDIQNLCTENHTKIKKLSEMNKARSEEIITKEIKPLEILIESKIKIIEDEKNREKEEAKRKEAERIEGIRKRMHDYCFEIEGRIKGLNNSKEAGDLIITFPEDPVFMEKPFLTEFTDAVNKLRTMRDEKKAELEKDEAFKKREAELKAQEEAFKKKAEELGIKLPGNVHVVGIRPAEPVKDPDPVKEAEPATVPAEVEKPYYSRTIPARDPAPEVKKDTDLKIGQETAFDGIPLTDDRKAIRKFYEEICTAKLPVIKDDELREEVKDIYYDFLGSLIDLYKKPAGGE